MIAVVHEFQPSSIPADAVADAAATAAPCSGTTTARTLLYLMSRGYTSAMQRFLDGIERGANEAPASPQTYTQLRARQSFHLLEGVHQEYVCEI